MDKVVRAIEQGLINHENISFDILRSKFGFNHDIWDQLGRGRNILNSEEQLDQYLYSYGLMIKNHWEIALSGLEISGDNLVVVDYGCGQGLASLLFREYILCREIGSVKKVVLIEPSKAALNRAYTVVKCCYPTSELDVFNKKLEDLVLEDLKFDADFTKIHLFSNILDLDGFEVDDVFKKIFKTKGIHQIIAVSHDRSHNGGAERLEGFFSRVVSYHKKAVFREAYLKRFSCRKGQPAIFFRLEMELPNGSV